MPEFAGSGDDTFLLVGLSGGWGWMLKEWDCRRRPAVGLSSDLYTVMDPDRSKLLRMVSGRARVTAMPAFIDISRFWWGWSGV